MTTHELPEDAIKLMVDLATSHMTVRDDTLCAAGVCRHPRIIEHAYGYIVFVASDPEAVTTALDGLRSAGFSEAFVDIYGRAAASENTIMLINFDRDAAPIDGLPVFDW
jgi:hypothetical protein